LLSLLLMIAAFYFARSRSVSAAAAPHGDSPRWRRAVYALDAFALACLVAALLAFGFRDSEVRVFTSADMPLAMCVLAVLARLCIAFPDGLRFRADRNLLETIGSGRHSETLALGLIWTLVGFFGSLGMNFAFHRFLFEHVFLFRSTRVPARWGMIAYLGIAMLAGLGAKRLVEALGLRLPRLRSLPVYAIICAVLLFEQRAAPLRLAHGEVDPDPLTDHLAQTPMRGGIVHLPAGGERGNYRYVLRQADHRRPLVTAVSGFSTPLLSEIEALSRRQPIPGRFFDVLEETPVSYLAVHRSQLRPESRVFVEYMLVRGTESGRLRYIRSFAGTGIDGNDGADLYAVTRTEPESKSAARLPFELPLRSWQALIQRDAINLLGRYQAWSQTVYRFYVASDRRMPRYAEFLRDMQSVSRGVMLDVPDEHTGLAERIRQFSDRWVERVEFRARYARLASAAYVDTLSGHAGITLAPAERAAFVEQLDRGATTRAQVLLAIVSKPVFAEKEDKRSLVLLHYFGYLHRNPDDPPDNNLDGFNYWLREVEGSGDLRRLPTAFMASGEYTDTHKK
jgi:hypothetical protein